MYIEQDCTFTHEGKDGILTDWHGDQIGTYRIVSTWKAE